MIRRILCTVTVAILLCIGSVYAENYVLETNFTGSVNSKAPEGFDVWKSGGAMGKTPKLYAVSGVFGQSDDNTSIQILSDFGVGTKYNPYIYKDVSLEGEFSLGIKLATDDFCGRKYVELGTVTSNGEETGYVAAQINAAGQLFAGGEIIQNKVDKECWYGIEMEFSTAGINIYVNGEYLKTLTAADISGVKYIKCGISDKSEASEKASVYFDDVYLKEGAPRRSSRIDISSERISIDKVNHTVSDIPADADAADVIADIITPNDESIKITDENGNDVKNVKHGSYLVAESCDGVNVSRYFIDLLKFRITGINNGDVLKDNSAVLGIAGEYARDITSVTYFSDAGVLGTAENTPYTISYKFEKAGSYEIWAEIVVGEERVSTPKVTVTYKPNTIPEVAILSVKNGDELSYSDDLTVKVSAEDKDGEITECYLYLDGAKVVSESIGSPYSFKIAPISSGEHIMYAAAIDNENGKAVSEEIRFSVKRVTSKTVSFADFNNGSSDWDINGDGGSASYVKVRDDFGLSYAVSVNAAPADADYAAANPMLNSSDSSLATSQAVLECDFMMDRVQDITVYPLIVRSQEGVFYRINNVSILNGKFSSRTIEPNEWYHIKYVFNLPKKRAELYLDGDLIESSEDVNITSFYNIRFNLFNYSKENTATVYFDNMHLYVEQEFPYVRNVQLLDKDGKSVASAAGDTAEASLSRIVLDFNANMRESSIKKDNFKLYVNGEEFDAFDVSFEDLTENSRAVLTLRSAAISNAVYSVIVSGDISNKFGQTPGADQKLTFKVKPGGFDIKNWSVKRGNTEIYDGSELGTGDRINVSASFVNDGNSNEPVYFIIAVYNGKVLSDFRIKSVDPNLSDSDFDVSESIEIGDASNGITVEGYLWSEDMRHSKSAYFRLGR